jgi:hypothetical protein
MRDYAKWAPTFWTGKTGREIIGTGQEPLILAFYLCTCPSSNWIGLYYIPIATISHETGLSVLKARRALSQLEQLEFSFYDEKSSLVFIPNAARYQIGESLKPADGRVARIVKDLKTSGTAELFRVSPPEAVAYRDAIIRCLEFPPGGRAVAPPCPPALSDGSRNRPVGNVPGRPFGRSR